MARPGFESTTLSFRFSVWCLWSLSHGNPNDSFELSEGESGWSSRYVPDFHPSTPGTTPAWDIITYLKNPSRVPYMICAENWKKIHLLVRAWDEPLMWLSGINLQDIMAVMSFLSLLSWVICWLIDRPIAKKLYNSFLPYNYSKKINFLGGYTYFDEIIVVHLLTCVN